MTTQTNEYTLSQHDYVIDDKTSAKHLVEAARSDTSNKAKILKLAMQVIPLGLAIYLLFGTISTSEKKLILTLIAGYYIGRIVTSIGIKLALKWTEESIKREIKKNHQTEWEKRTIALSESSIFEKRESGEVLYYWSAVTSIQRLENLLVIIINDSYKIRIPKRAFSSEEKFRAFEKECFNLYSKFSKPTKPD